MATDLRDFWQRFQTGIEVAVSGDVPDKLLGIRDGFVRYFREGLGNAVRVSVAPQPQAEADTPLPLTDGEILELACSRAARLDRDLDRRFAFYVGSESGLLTFESGGEVRRFVRSWSVIRGLGEEAWGSSGAVQLPERLVRDLDEAELPFAIPGRRRRGGMVSSLTAGIENLRSATALATLHALATLMYGLRESRSRPPARPPSNQ